MGSIADRRLRSPNPEDRAEAIRTIAELKDQRGAPIMMEALSYTSSPLFVGLRPGDWGTSDERGEATDRAVTERSCACSSRICGGWPGRPGRPGIGACAHGGAQQWQLYRPCLSDCCVAPAWISPTRRWPSLPNRWPNRTIWPCVLLQPMRWGRRLRLMPQERFPC